MPCLVDYTIAPACADRSGGPAMKPKPGDSYETGADGAGGWPSGAAETLRPRGDAVRARGDAVESCRVTTCSELRWKAHISFWAKTDMPKQLIYFWFYCNSPNGYAHSNCTAILCKGVWSIRKVTVPLSKPIAMRHHR